MPAGTELATTRAPNDCLSRPSEVQLVTISRAHVAGSAGGLTRTGRVKSLESTDVDHIADLHARAFGGDRGRADLRSFLKGIFFEHPWLDETLPSLGYFDRRDQLVGCLGVMPRPMTFNGRPIRAVTTHNFMVDPGHRGGLAALHLMKSLLAHSPDLTLADGNEPARRISEAMGGRVVQARSGRWLRVLRPSGLGVCVVGRRLPGPLERAMRVLATFPDDILSRLPGSAFAAPFPEGSAADMTAIDFVANVSYHTRALALKPIYTEESASWLLARLRSSRRNQILRARAVHDGGGVAGWYVYYSRPHEVGRVLQLGARRGARPLVLRHLFADALGEGNVGLSGQADPVWVEDLRAASCVFRPGSTHLLAHVADATVGQCLATEDAFLTRLEGEGWLHFAC